MNFKNFIKENKDTIERLSEENCKRNEDGKVVIEKDDKDWDDEIIVDKI